MTTGKILLEFDPELKNLLPALKKISARFGYISENDAQKAADYFSVPLSGVFETASFYDLLSTKKEPPLKIQICSGANCAIRNSSRIIKEVENQFKIKAGDEFNPKVRLEVISCLGQCGSGPIMIVNGNVFTKVTPSGVDDILRNYL